MLANHPQLVRVLAHRSPPAVLAALELETAAVDRGLAGCSAGLFAFLSLVVVAARTAAAPFVVVAGVVVRSAGETGVAVGVARAIVAVLVLGRRMTIAPPVLPGALIPPALPVILAQ